VRIGHVGFFVGVVAVAACSGASSRSFDLQFNDTANDNTPVRLHQGAMPQGFAWTGVYQSPQIGQIDLVENGDAIIGRYEYDRGSCHVVARIEGTRTGNLMRFRWTEDHRPCGRIEPVTGHGYFLFWTDTDNARGRMDGEWGYGEEDRGNGHWSGFQLRGRRPSVGGAPESSSGGEGSGGSGSGSGSGDGSGSGGGSSSGGGTKPLASRDLTAGVHR
jgi:hypothetical protein